LVRANVDVIVTQTTPASLAAKRATTKIPIVMATGGDAVGSGLVASLARPGKNVTGMTFMGTDIVGKRVEFLRALKPEARRVAFLGNNEITPSSSRSVIYIRLPLRWAWTRYLFTRLLRRHLKRHSQRCLQPA
jgi:ABC-type uncharacterized transport system substrate-binding protein